MIQTRRCVRLLLGGALSILLAACASIMGGKVMTLSEADLTRAIESRAPFQKRLLEVLDVRVNKPSVRVLPESNRLSTDLDLVTTERVSGKTYSGSISVDYGLRYDEASQSIRLTQVRVNRLQINNLPSPEKTGLGHLGALIAEQLLDDVAIYHFRPADLNNAKGYGYKPSAVTVTSRGVEVRLVPIR